MANCVNYLVNVCKCGGLQEEGRIAASSPLGIRRKLTHSFLPISTNIFIICHTGLIAASCGQLGSILRSSENQKKTMNNGGIEVSMTKVSRNGNMKMSANRLSNDVYFNDNGLYY